MIGRPVQIRILRVAVPQATDKVRTPLVIAGVDNQLVKYSRRDGWTCDCDEPGDTCEHVDMIDILIDDRVIRP